MPSAKLYPILPHCVAPPPTRPPTVRTNVRYLLDYSLAPLTLRVYRSFCGAGVLRIDSLDLTLADVLKVSVHLEVRARRELVDPNLKALLIQGITGQTPGTEIRF